MEKWFYKGQTAWKCLQKLPPDKAPESPDPLGELKRSPRAASRNGGPTSKGAGRKRERERREWREGRGAESGGEKGEEGGEGTGKGGPPSYCWTRAPQKKTLLRHWKLKIPVRTLHTQCVVSWRTENFKVTPWKVQWGIYNTVNKDEYRDRLERTGTYSEGERDFYLTGDHV